MSHYCTSWHDLWNMGQSLISDLRHIYGRGGMKAGDHKIALDFQERDVY